MNTRTRFQISSADLDDAHNSRSAEMILEAAALVRPRSIAVLGCGKCADIPLRQLLAISHRLDLVDTDRDALKFIESKYFQPGAHSATLYHSDLTGLLRLTESTARDLVANASSPTDCLDKLGTWLSKTVPDFWRPPRHEQYDLVICSAVVTQLQAKVRERLERLFFDRFGARADVLLAHAGWKDSVWKFARKIEAAFIEHLEALTCRSGIIYLADTVHVCWLEQSDADMFTTDGSWVATGTSCLSDYLRSDNTIIKQGKWQWVRRLREGRYWGRLYGVQAIIYKPLQN